MNIATRRPAALAAGLVVAAALALPGAAGAQPRAVPAPPEFSLAISPTRLVVGQGDLATTQEVKVINGGTSTMHVDVDLQNFTANRDGALLFAQEAPYSASQWVTVTPMSFDVPAGETRVVTAEIDVPASPEPGDHQLALVFLVPAGESEANVRINRGIGMPVFITVPGPIDDSAEVTGLEAGGFATGGPVDVTATIEATGTVHRDFRGDTPLLLDASGTAASFPDFTVPRDSVRDITTTWDPPLICVCNPSVTVTNADGTTSSQSVQVIVFPLPSVLAVLAALLLLVGGYHLARRHYRASVRKAAAELQPVAGGVGV